MAMLKRTSNGTYWITSKSDPRWKAYDYGNVGGLIKPEEINVLIEQKKKELNEDPPDDLEWGYMKY